MRIVTWNCQSGFVKKKKASEIFAKDPDIAIIQECSKEDANTSQNESYRSLWFGDAERNKGLAVFYKSAWKLSPVEKPDHKWIVAIDVVGPENFTLIAVWAWIEKGGIPGYVKLIRQSLVKHPEWFDRGPVVIAGDFNSNSRWDKLPEENHSSLVGHLAQRGLVSAYHSRHDEEQGRETKSTFYQGRKFDQPYHIDYIFTPIEWNARVNNFEIGDFGQWSGLSDHCPLTIDVASN